MHYPDLDGVIALSKSFNVIPVCLEIYADLETPVSIFKRFEHSPYCFMLESVEGGEKWARYSFIGNNPFLIAKYEKNRTVIQKRDGSVLEEAGNPIDALKELMGQYKSADIPGLPRFHGGAVGYFGYDLIRYFENLPDVPEDDLHLPEAHFMFTDEVLAFDHLKQMIRIIVNLHVTDDLEKEYADVTERIDQIHEEIKKPQTAPGNDNGKPGMTAAKNKAAFTSNISKEDFCANVLKAKEYIRNGDIFQVVLSQRLSIQTDQDPFSVYRVLRLINPSPYMYYLKFNDYCIVGASPEMLVRVENGTVETCPIAGTRRRGATEAEDAMLEKELLADEKELAEHTMLVDLGRNDIGRISKYGSVKVRDPMHIEKYSHVMHIVTNVSGELPDGKDAFDALMSVMPAGTLSGAPKIRAMEIIDELEMVKRGTYGGAIGYLGFNGNLDSCITIRTMVFKDGMVYVQAGAGIVADSIPETEYEECMNKAKALLAALEMAGDRE